MPEGVLVPEWVRLSVEAVAFVAREDRRVDQTAGVSQRLAISLLEVVAASAERRALLHGGRPVARPLDLYQGLPAITGKLELEYEGELQGAERVAREIVQRAFGLVLPRYRLRTEPIVAHFEEGNLLTLPEGDVEEALKAMAGVPGLLEAARALAEGEAPEVLLSAGEFVLEGLVGRRKLSRGEATYQAAERPRSYGN